MERKFSENVGKFVYTSQLLIAGFIRKLETDNPKTYICIWKIGTELSTNIVALLFTLFPLSQYWLFLEIVNWRCWDGFFFARVFTIPRYEKTIIFWAVLEAPNSSKSITTQITNDENGKQNHKLPEFLTSNVAINLHKKYFALHKIWRKNSQGVPQKMWQNDSSVIYRVLSLSLDWHIKLRFCGGKAAQNSWEIIVKE